MQKPRLEQIRFDGRNRKRLWKTERCGWRVPELPELPELPERPERKEAASDEPAIHAAR
jgi:hypothetical protein